MTFGEKLKQIRKERGLSQDAMAELLKTSKQVISRYENGKRTPKITIAQQYAAILGISATFLLDDNYDAQTDFGVQNELDNRIKELTKLVSKFDDTQYDKLIDYVKYLSQQQERSEK